MTETRAYHGIVLGIARAESSRICYILLPEGLKGDGADVTFLLEEDTTHFSPVAPRLEKALNWLFKE